MIDSMIEIISRCSAGRFYRTHQLTVCILKRRNVCLRGEAALSSTREKKMALRGVKKSNLALTRVPDSRRCSPTISVFHGTFETGRRDRACGSLDRSPRMRSRSRSRERSDPTLARCFLRAVWHARFRLCSLSPRLCGRLFVHPQARRTANNHRQQWTRNGVRKLAGTLIASPCETLPVNWSDLSRG